MGQRQLLRIDIEGLGTTALRQGDELRLGRHPSNDIVIDETEVSRRHARLVWERLDGRAKVEDLNSSNGVLVNGSLIDQPHELAPGDRVQIGSIVLVMSYQVDQGSSRRARRPTYAAQLTGEPTRKGWLSARMTLQTLLETLGEEQKTGVLQLGKDDDNTVVILKLGRVIGAEASSVHKPSQAIRVIVESVSAGAMYRFYLKHDVEGPLDIAPRSLFADAAATARWDRTQVEKS